MTLMKGPSWRMKTILGFTTAEFFPLCSCSSKGFALLQEQPSSLDTKHPSALKELRRRERSLLFLLGRIVPLTFAFSSKSDITFALGIFFFFLLHLQTIWAIHRDLVKVLVIFMFLEDRNKNLFLLQKWTYLLCTQKLNSSAWKYFWVITYWVISFLTVPES